MDRRTFVSSLGAASLWGAGCLDESEPHARLAWLWLRNDRKEDYDVDVVIEDAGEAVFSKTYELGATPETANVREDAPVDGAGLYTVRATMDGETREVETADYVTESEPCLGVRFSLLDNGSVDYWTKSMQQC